jgi:RNA polymerase sigma factor (sigma-70 family)
LSGREIPHLSDRTSDSVSDCLKAFTVGAAGPEIKIPGRDANVEAAKGAPPETVTGCSSSADEPARDADSRAGSADVMPPQIDSGLLRRVSERDPHACGQFLAMVHERACRLVQDALTGRVGERSGRIAWLIHAYRRDELQIQAALLSAQTSFHRHFLDTVDTSQINDDKDYVTALIGQAYRRWKRREYRDQQTLRHTAAGNAPLAGNGKTLLAQLADSAPGPEQQVVVNDFYEKLVEEIHLFSRGLNEREAQVVSLRLFQEMTYEQIAAEVNTSVATVCRICQQAIAHLRKRFRESID